MSASPLAKYAMPSAGFLNPYLARRVSGPNAIPLF
jgi:hypothetical protein